MVDDKDWYQLYQHKTNKTYWRLDKWDKYQEQFFVRLDKTDNWIDFDDKELRIELLLLTAQNMLMKKWELENEF
jgi:hypothetical protein